MSQTLLSPDVDFFTQLASSYPESIAVLANSLVLTGFRAVSDAEWDGDPNHWGHTSVIHTGSGGDKIVVCAVKFLLRDPRDYPSAVLAVFSQWEHEGSVPFETPKGTIMVIEDIQAQQNQDLGNTKIDESRQPVQPLRGPIRPRRALSLDHKREFRSREGSLRRSFSTSFALKPPKKPARTVLDVHTFKGLDHANRLGTQLQYRLSELQNAVADALALADEDLDRTHSYLRNVENERAELLKLLSQHDLLNGHVSEVDHQSYRIQYELALLEDKSRETFELVDNFLARVNQIR